MGKLNFSSLESESLLDLISEKNASLGQYTVDQWQEVGAVDISPSEWNFLSKLLGGKHTIASAARSVGISRQAAHKLYRNLESKDLVAIEAKNGRERSLSLTTLGEECYQQYLSLSDQLEKAIASELGEENLILLKKILTRPWLDQTKANAS